MNAYPRYGTPIVRMSAFRQMRPGTLFRKHNHIYRVIQKVGLFTYQVSKESWRPQ